MTTAVIYSNSNQECERMGMLLRSVSTEFHEYVLGNHFTQQQFQMEFGADATYPQVSIGNKHIGSMKETLHYLSSIGYDKN